MNTLRILGTRGIPAAHGGFETFAENLALYLVDQGWRVIVYCQDDGSGPIAIDEWCGIERVHIPVSISGAKGTIMFDWMATRHAATSNELCLTLGYNTAMFCSLLRLKGIPNLINMDGIEWSRAKWGPIAKTWFWMNDWAGCWLGNHLIADHPLIAEHLASRVRRDKITMISYGADAVTEIDDAPVRRLNLIPGRYLTVIARPEPENSLLEIVSGFSARKRDFKLVVLGNYDEKSAYHCAVKAAANDSVQFVGAIYDKTIVQALRFYSALYVHGHQVGGTNPSLVEALACGNAVIAHDNRFNRWVVGAGAEYFSDATSFSERLDTLLSNEQKLAEMRVAAKTRFAEEFTWPKVLGEYEAMLAQYVPSNALTAIAE